MHNICPLVLTIGYGFSLVYGQGIPYFSHLQESLIAIKNNQLQDSFGRDPLEVIVSESQTLLYKQIFFKISAPLQELNDTQPDTVTPSAPNIEKVKTPVYKNSDPNFRRYSLY